MYRLKAKTLNKDNSTLVTNTTVRENAVAFWQDSSNYADNEMHNIAKTFVYTVETLITPSPISLK